MEDFEIIALNGITGECLITEEEATQDDWCQRHKETPYDPLEEIRQGHETWLAKLEGLAVEAIALGNWEAVYNHIASFSSTMILEITLHKAGASAEELETPSADPFQPTQKNR